MKSTNKAFTIVELIVVITILAILWTIWFISFSSHLVWTRDTNRLSQLSTMHEWLDVYSTQNELPTPENSVEVRASWSLIWYQWYAWKNVLGMIWYSKWWKDPKDEQYYSYYLTEDKKHFQLMAFLEDDANKQLWINIINQTNAVDYTRRYPTVYWKKLGILTESGTNAPIQEVSSIVSSWYLDVGLTTNKYTANFDDNTKLTWTGWVLYWLQNHLLWWWKLVWSCKNLLETVPLLKNKDWNYLINPSTDKIFSVYCDMTTDDGWWTLITAKVKYNFPNNWYFQIDTNKKYIDYSYIRWNYVSPLWKELPLIYKIYNKDEWKLLLFHTDQQWPINSDWNNTTIHYQTSWDFSNAFTIWEKNTSWVLQWDLKTAIQANLAKKITWRVWVESIPYNHLRRGTAWRDPVHISFRNYLWFPADPYEWTWKIWTENFSHSYTWIDWRSISIWIK